MKRIKTREDIENLRQDSYDPRLLTILQKKLSDMLAAYQENGAAWDPDQLGYFCLIEEGDDVRDLGVVGMNPARDGLVGVFKEFVIWYPEIRFWEVCVLFCNDYGINFFVPEAEWLDPELRSMLADEAEEIVRSNASTEIDG